MLVVHVFHNKKPFNQLYITNKMECLSFKSGRAMQVAKLIKKDWPIVLQLEFQLYTTLVLSLSMVVLNSRDR